MSEWTDNGDGTHTKVQGMWVARVCHWCFDVDSVLEHDPLRGKCDGIEDGKKQCDQILVDWGKSMSDKTYDEPNEQSMVARIDMLYKCGSPAPDTSEVRRYLLEQVRLLFKKLDEHSPKESPLVPTQPMSNEKIAEKIAAALMKKFAYAVSRSMWNISLIACVTSYDYSPKDTLHKRVKSDILAALEETE